MLPLQHLWQQGPVSLSDKTSYHKILWNFETSKISSLNYPTTLTFDRHIGSSTAEVPVKFHSDWIILNTNLMASSLLQNFTIRHLIGYWNKAKVVAEVSAALPLCSLWPLHTYRPYRKISNIRCTNFTNLNVFRLTLLLSLPNPMKPGVKLRMKM